MMYKVVSHCWKKNLEQTFSIVIPPCFALFTKVCIKNPKNGLQFKKPKKLPKSLGKFISMNQIVTLWFWNWLQFKGFDITPHQSPRRRGPWGLLPQELLNLTCNRALSNNFWFKFLVFSFRFLFFFVCFYWYRNQPWFFSSGQ